jgi:2-acylglycerol O-acyltransferase 2
LLNFLIEFLLTIFEGFHPHGNLSFPTFRVLNLIFSDVGIISVGAWTNFATEANDVSSLFPGLKFNLVTLPQNFRIPLYRDFILQHGLISCSKSSCSNALSKQAGESIVIVVGGADESLHAHPGTYELILKKRLGFIKLAIQTG